MSGAALNGVGQLGDPAAGGGGGGPSQAWKIGNLTALASTVGLWTLDNDLADESGNGNTLVAYGTAPPSLFNQGYGTHWCYFDGNYLLSCLTPAVLDLVNDMTLSLTVWPVEEVTTGFPRLICKGDTVSAAANNNANYIFWIDPASDDYRWLQESGSGVNDIKALPGNYGVDRMTFTPVHLAVRRTKSSKTLDFFVNGRLMGSVAYTTDPDGGADSNFSVGGELRTTGATNEILQGWCMKNVRIDDAALSDAQLLTDANLVLDGRFT